MLGGQERCLAPVGSPHRPKGEGRPVQAEGQEIPPRRLPASRCSAHASQRSRFAMDLLTPGGHAGHANGKENSRLPRTLRG